MSTSVVLISIMLGSRREFSPFVNQLVEMAYGLTLYIDQSIYESTSSHINSLYDWTKGTVSYSQNSHLPYCRLLPASLPPPSTVHHHHCPPPPPFTTTTVHHYYLPSPPPTITTTVHHHYLPSPPPTITTTQATAIADSDR